MITMGKIMMDSEVRASAKEVSEALQKAGINFGTQVRFRYIQLETKEFSWCYQEAMAFMQAFTGPKKP